MKNTTFQWLAVAALSAGLFQACGSSKDDECADVNNNDICDVDEPGHGQCPALDRDAEGECPSELTCGPREILVADACEACPTGEHAENNACVADVTTCPSGEILNGTGGCCVDADANDICDDQENQCPTGEIVDGSGGCCADANENDICDDQEVTCSAGEIEDGSGGCCADANENDVCDVNEVSCDAGEIPDGLGACCVDANANLTCDDAEAGLNCDATEVIYAGACCADTDNDSLCDLDPADDCIGLNNGQDSDEDGFCADLDCDDNDAFSYPGAAELCGSNVVNDCDHACHNAPVGCAAADVVAAKDGKASMRSGNNWTDVTAAFMTSNNVHTVTGSEQIYLCGNHTFSTRIEVSGAGNAANVISAVAGTTPALSAEMNDKPVLMVADGASLYASDIAIMHNQTFSGDNGNGLFCKGASFGVSSVRIQSNSAKLGAGLFSQACTSDIVGNMSFSSNRGEEGTALYFTDESKSFCKGGNMQIGGNTIGSAASAAFTVTGKSDVNWALDPDSPVVGFRGNYAPANAPRDILVNDDSRLTIRDANFMSPGLDHVRTGASTHTYVTGTGYDLACTATNCTP